MCCTTTAKANDVGENINYKYGEIEVGSQYTWIIFQ